VAQRVLKLDGTLRVTVIIGLSPPAPFAHPARLSS